MVLPARRFRAALFRRLCAAALAGAAPAGFAREPAPAARPNILFIVFDDWGGGVPAGAYGRTWIETPHFDRVAREGVRFTHVFTSNPKCAPCRASMLTGRNTWQLREGVSHNGYFPAGFAVFPDLLEQAGYVIGLTGKGWGPGDFTTLAGFTRNPAGPSFDARTLRPPTKLINANDYAGNFEDFLNRRPPGRPFCFWMGIREPHRQYDYGSGARAGKDPGAVDVPRYLPDLPVVRQDLLDYALEVEWGDRHVGRALALLEARGELENTFVVVTSDHGMPFPFVKGQIHEDGFRIPLAMRWGRVIRPGRVVEDFVNVRDFAPTFLDVAGLPPHPQMTGSSLLGILRSPASGWIEGRDTMLVGKERHDLGRPHDWGYPVRAIRTREYLYVRNLHPHRWPAGNPETDFGNVDPGPTKEAIKALGGYYYDLSFGRRPAEELFRLTDDPAGIRNLAHDPAFAPVLEDLRRRLQEALRADGDPRATGDGAVLERYGHWVGSRAKAYDTWLEARRATGAEPAGR